MYMYAFFFLFFKKPPGNAQVGYSKMGGRLGRTDISQVPLPPWNGTKLNGTVSAAGTRAINPASRRRAIPQSREPVTSYSHGKAQLTM